MGGNQQAVIPTERTKPPAVIPVAVERSATECRTYWDCKTVSPEKLFSLMGGSRLSLRFAPRSAGMTSSGREGIK